MTNVTIKLDNDQLLATSPYNPDLPSRAKQIGGRWDSARKGWRFDARDDERVRELYRSIYGTDGGADSGDVISIRATFADGDSAYHGGIFVGGRQLARATGRDSGATLADGVIVLAGNFSSGGSVKNWRTLAAEGTTFELRDIPREKLAEIQADDRLTDLVVIEQGQNNSALTAERERLIARIAEIDALLAS